jgi:hypothetical protein
MLKVNRDDSHPWNNGWGDGVHTRDLKVDETADINNLTSKQFSTSGNVNIQGDLVFNGTNKWIVHTPDDGNKTMNIAPGNDKGEWQKQFQTTIEHDGKVRVGNHLEVPAKMTIGSNEDPRKLPDWLTLSVDHPKADSHIRLKTKGDDNKNVYLINRDGHFRLNYQGSNDVFGVNKDGHNYIRHTGDSVMHLEGDGAHPFISLGKTGTWDKKKMFIQNVNAGSDDPIFRIGTHGVGPLMDMSKQDGARWPRKDGRWTHLDHTDGKNYIRGDTIHDNIFIASKIFTSDGRLAGSDRNMKENITPLEQKEILNKISKLNGYIYNLKKDEKKKKKFGVIAQEVLQEFPDLVEESSNGYLAVDYDQLIALLIESVKELNARCPK